LLRNVRPCATDGDVDRSSRFPSLDPPHEPARILSFHYQRSRQYRDGSSVRTDNQRTHIPHRGDACGRGPLACVSGRSPGRPHRVDAVLRCHRRTGGAPADRLAHPRSSIADNSGIVPTSGRSPDWHRHRGSRVRARKAIIVSFWPPMHPARLRCSSLTYSRYARAWHRAVRGVSIPTPREATVIV